MPLPTRTLLICLALAACGGKSATLHLMEPAAAERTLPDRLGRVEVLNVALPDYAAAPEIAAQAADGTLHSFRHQLWAATPDKTMTRILAEQISEASGATAIAEPWPLSVGPDRRLEVRVDRLFAGADGALHLAGQYFVTPAGGGGRNIVRRFDIAVPLGAGGVDAIAAAQASALQQLAALIAKLS